MKKKTMQLTIRLGCSAGHKWAPGTMPVLIGNPYDSTIVLEDFTGPVAIDIDLREPEKCPTCVATAKAIHFQAAPSEMM